MRPVRQDFLDEISEQHESARRLWTQASGSGPQIEWKDVPMASNWTGPLYYHLAHGRVYLGGSATRLFGVATIGTLPAGARPSHNLTLRFGSTNTAGMVDVQVFTSGALVAVGYSSGDTLLGMGSFIL